MLISDLDIFQGVTIYIILIEKTCSPKIRERSVLTMRAVQVKIFCDKGAERKLRDEERRAAKRRMTPSGKRRLDEMYHETFERSVFSSIMTLYHCFYSGCTCGNFSMFSIFLKPCSLSSCLSFSLPEGCLCSYIYINISLCLSLIHLSLYQ